MSLDATIGGATANSYALRSEADSYFADRPLISAAWTSASSTQKDAALIMATGRLDAETFAGSPASVTQALQWPRYDVRNRAFGFYPLTSIPAPLKEATYLLALEIITDPTILGQSKLNNFEAIKLGPLQLNMRQPPRDGNGKLSAQVLRLITPLITGDGWGGARLVRA